MVEFMVQVFQKHFKSKINLESYLVIRYTFEGIFFFVKNDKNESKTQISLFFFHLLNHQGVGLFKEI